MRTAVSFAGAAAIASVANTLKLQYISTVLTEYVRQVGMNVVSETIFVINFQYCFDRSGKLSYGSHPATS